MKAKLAEEFLTQPLTYKADRARNQMTTTTKVSEAQEWLVYLSAIALGFVLGRLYPYCPPWAQTAGELVTAVVGVVVIIAVWRDL